MYQTLNIIFCVVIINGLCNSYLYHMLSTNWESNFILSKFSSSSVVRSANESDLEGQRIVFNDNEEDVVQYLLA